MANNARRVVVDSGQSLSIGERFTQIQKDNDDTKSKRTVSVQQRQSSRSTTRGVTKPRRASEGRRSLGSQRARDRSFSNGTQRRTRNTSTARANGNGSSGRGRTRGRGRGRGARVSKSKEALDKDLQSYMLADPEKGKELLDSDLESYMKARDSTSATIATATSTAAPTEKKTE